jgi:hypothetical protein
MVNRGGGAKSRFNATLRTGNAVGSLIDAIHHEGVTRCGIQEIQDQQLGNIGQALLLKRESSL